MPAPLRTPPAARRPRITFILILLGATPGAVVTSARAQVANVPAAAPDSTRNGSGDSIGPPSPPLPLVLAAFDISVATTFEARVIGTSSTMTSTFVTGRIAPVIPVSRKLFLAFPLDASVSFYQFRGSPELLPDGAVPWDQV